jgi:hypothetical protein
MTSPDVVELKSTLSKQNICGLALDIDETLSWTLGYWFSEMQRLFGNPENLTVRQIVDKYRYSQNVPYWQTPEALEWVKDKTNDNEAYKKLDLIPNSNIFVNKINKIIPIVAYITTRPATVINGTRDWLLANDFPRATIILRPVDIPKSEGNPWKAGVLEYLYPQVMGIVDDHPDLAKYLQNYSGKFFMFDNKTSAIDNKNFIPCPTWEDVYQHILLQSDDS